jgi:hypothetical protein
MQEIDDQIAAEPESSGPCSHEVILEQSRLAKELRNVFVRL